VLHMRHVIEGMQYSQKLQGHFQKGTSGFSYRAEPK